MLIPSESSVRFLNPVNMVERFVRFLRRSIRWIRYGLPEAIVYRGKIVSE